MAWPETRFTDLVGVEYPIVQAPMASVSTPEMVAAVSNAGGLGSLGGAMLPADELRAQIGRIRELTAKPFAVNLFAWPEDPPEAAEALRAMSARLAPHREAVGLEDPELTAALPMVAMARAQLEVIAAERVPVFSFTFGIPELAPLKKAGVVSVGTATSPAEAVALEEAGADAVIAQGYEAGGHRGAFLHDPAESLIGTVALVPQVADAVGLPVVATGGIMDGRGIAAALTLGAEAAALGTAYLMTDESAASEPHKRRLADGPPERMVITTALSGRAARAIGTGMVAEIEGSGLEIPPFPAQVSLTRPIHAADEDDPKSERVFMLGGQAGPLARRMAAGELTALLAREAEAALGAG